MCSLGQRLTEEALKEFPKRTFILTLRDESNARQIEAHAFKICEGALAFYAVDPARIGFVSTPLRQIAAWNWFDVKSVFEEGAGADAAKGQ